MKKLTLKERKFGIIQPAGKVTAVSIKESNRFSLTKTSRKILKEMALDQSIAFKIFKKNGARYGSYWPRTDEQDEKVGQIENDLRLAGFKRIKTSGSEYEFDWVKDAERVRVNYRIGMGYSAIWMISPDPPQRPQRPSISRPEYTSSNLGKLKSALMQDIINSGLVNFTAEDWKRSAQQRGTYTEIDNINKKVGIGLDELWPQRFHQLMKILINMNKISVIKRGSKNVYSIKK